MPKTASHKPVRQRRERSDSRAAAVKVAMAAATVIRPPDHVPLDDDDMPFFNSVIKEFARSEWTDHQLECAALLARAMRDMVRDQNDLRSQGTILYTEKEHPFINPLKSAVTQTAGQILAMRRSLSLHARARAGDSRDVAKRQADLREQERGFEGSDGLIARPTVMN